MLAQDKERRVLKRWTQDEDQHFVETVEASMNLGKTFTESVGIVANDLERTAAACLFRWSRNIRKHLEGSELLERMKRNNPIYHNAR